MSLDQYSSWPSETNARWFIRSPGRSCRSMSVQYVTSSPSRSARNTSGDSIQKKSAEPRRARYGRSNDTTRDRVLKEPPEPWYRLYPPQSLYACHVVTEFWITKAAWLESSRSGERHVTLRAVARDELQHVDALGPVVGDVDPERRRPVRLDHVGPGRSGWAAVDRARAAGATARRTDPRGPGSSRSDTPRRGRKLPVSRRNTVTSSPTCALTASAYPSMLVGALSGIRHFEVPGFRFSATTHGCLRRRRGRGRSSGRSLPGTGSTHRSERARLRCRRHGDPRAGRARRVQDDDAGRDGEQQHHRDAARMPGTERVPRDLDPHRTHPVSPRWPT